MTDMRRIIALIAAISLVIPLAGCSLISFRFDPETQAAIDVITVSDFDISYYDDVYMKANDPNYDFEPREPGEKKYCAVGKTGLSPVYQRVEVINAFEPDDADFYTVVSGGIVWRFGENSRGRYETTDKRLFDKNGKIVEMTDELSEVFDSILDLEPHDMFLCQIIKDGGEYFVYNELNVNWFYPCELYHYEKDSKSLEMLVQFDHERIVGVRLPKEELTV